VEIEPDRWGKDQGEAGGEEIPDQGEIAFALTAGKRFLINRELHATR